MIGLKEITSLRFGGEPLEAIRAQAKAGNQDALKRFVYFSAWQAIKSDKAIPLKKKTPLLRELLERDPIEVKFHGR
jgi:hypothetical protein